jgi:tRNA A37 threonylcarbamoyladenosine modification protein TsaB
VVKSLLIENSTDIGTVALADGIKVLALGEITKHGMLSATIRDLVLEFGPPDEIIVGLGPGSYAGSRVAVATVIGLKIGFRCPAFGCPSVLAYGAATYYVVGDARRGSVFLASIEENRLVRVPELRSGEEFRLLLPELRSRAVFAVGPIPGVVDVPIVRPRAEYLLSRRDSFQPSLEPLYLKEPHITKPKKSRA